MIFFPEKTFTEKPEDYGYRFEDVLIRTKDGVTLHGWYLKARANQAARVILFFHGNAGNISHRLYKVKGWIARGYDVLLVDYRGYGKSTGKIHHENDVIRDAEAAAEWLLREKERGWNEIILYGESLGTAPAVRLGTGHAAAAVILEAPFTSFYDLARVHYPFVPKFVLKDFEFSNLTRIAELKAPLFILHGTGDEICPYAMAGELFERAPEPKAFFSIPNGTHNDLPAAAGEDYWGKPHQFIERTV